MKEAAGEANMTVITIVLIGVVAAVGAILIPRILRNLEYRSCCQESGYNISGNMCVNPNGATSYSLKTWYNAHCKEDK